MSSSTTKPPNGTTSVPQNTDKKAEEQPQLGQLEEDDEFEEFEEEQWDESESNLSHIVKSIKSADPNVKNDNLWEDNWDDDDFEEEFSVQLRTALAENSNAMSTS